MDYRTSSSITTVGQSLLLSTHSRSAMEQSHKEAQKKGRFVGISSQQVDQKKKRQGVRGLPAVNELV
jgi:hypothetical protein